MRRKLEETHTKMFENMKRKMDKYVEPILEV